MTKYFISMMVFKSDSEHKGQSIYILPCRYGAEDKNYEAHASRICLCPNGSTSLVTNGNTNYKLNIHREQGCGLQLKCVE